MAPIKKTTARLKNSAAALPPKDDPLKADFRNFLFAIWKHLGLPDPTWQQYDIAQWLQHGPRRQITEAFRGVGKSWITAAYVCWLLYCDPQIKTMVVSANATKANEFTTFVLQLLRDVPFLQHLQPRSDQRMSMTSFDVGPAQPDIAPSVKSVGITGQLTGSRSNVIVADDIEVPHNSDTQGKRERILELVKEFDAVLKPQGKIAYLGTPQTELSIYNVLQERGYVARIWPARFPADAAKYGPRLSPAVRKKLDEGAKPGTSTEPSRFTDEDLRERELSYGRSGFALQFQLDTALSDADKYPLKLSDLIVYPCDPFRAPIDWMWASGPEQVYTNLPLVGLQGDRYHRPAWCSADVAPYEGSVMFVDPSGRGRDETAYAVVKLLHGRLFLVASGGYLGGYDDKTLYSLLMVAKRHHVKKILTEPNYGGGMFTRLLQGAAQKTYECGVEDAEWSRVAKEQRIVDTLEPVMNQHRLIVCPSVIQDDYNSVLKRDGERAPYYRLFYQMGRMVKEKGALAQDDRLDALAGAVAHWTAHMSRDTDRAVTEHKDKMLDDELERFMKHALGDKGGGPQRQWASRTARSVHGRRH